MSFSSQRDDVSLTARMRAAFIGEPNGRNEIGERTSNAIHPPEDRPVRLNTHQPASAVKPTTVSTMTQNP
jgi:hypothetical protein